MNLASCKNVLFRSVTNIVLIHVCQAASRFFLIGQAHSSINIRPLTKYRVANLKIIPYKNIL